MTQSCRINGEPHTLFPFDCSLSNLMRVKRLLHGGMKVKDGGKEKVVVIREHTFLDNSNVPDDIRVRGARRGQGEGGGYLGA